MLTVKAGSHKERIIDMAYTYENVIPTLIENTTMQKRLLNGVHRTYMITANEGYVLHDKDLDFTTPEDRETFIAGYTTGTCTCAASYDFAVNPREFYAVPADSVPADQIFGGGDNDHETM